MQTFSWIRWIIGVCALCTSCGGDTKIENTKKQNSTTDAIQIRYARGFKVQTVGTQKLVTLYKPCNTCADSIRYWLYPRGEQARDVPPDIAPAYRIGVPVRSWIPLSHTFIACGQALEAKTRLLAVNEADYLPDTTLLALIKAGKVQNLGVGSDIDQEILAGLGAELVMSNELSPSLARYQATGKAVILNGDWQETHPLGRAEWLKFIALFLREDEKAAKIFADIEKEYLQAKMIASRARHKPKILVDLPYKGTWYVPAGESYLARLLADAGAAYAWANHKGKGSLPLDFEAVYPVAMQAEVWLHMGMCRTKAELLQTDARFKDWQVVKTGQLYNNNLQSTPVGGNRYFMQGIITPHWILQDIIKILHPDLLPQHTLKYYRRLE